MVDTVDTIAGSNQTSLDISQNADQSPTLDVTQFQFFRDIEIYGWYSPEFRNGLIKLLSEKYKEFVDLRDLFKQQGYRSEGIVECFDTYLHCVKVLLNTFYTKDNEEFLLSAISQSMPALDNGSKLQEVYKTDAFLRPVVIIRSINFIEGISTFLKNEFGQKIDGATLEKLENAFNGSKNDPLGLSGINKIFRAVCVIILCGFFDEIDSKELLDQILVFLSKRHNLYKIEIGDQELPTWEALNYEKDFNLEL